MDEDKDVEMNPDIAPEVNGSQEETAAHVDVTLATPARKRPLKLIIAALIAAAIVVLIGGSVFGYTAWYQNPDKVVHDAVLNAIKAETISSSGTITYTSDDLKMDITLDGKSAEGDGDFTISTKVTIDTDEMKQDFTATGTGRIVDDTLYIKISGVEDIVKDTALQSGGQIPEYAASIFGKIEDRWISIQTSDYQDINQDIAAQQTCFLNLMEKIQTDSSMSNEVAALYREHQVLVIEEELGTKEVNGVSSLGYKVSSDKDAANAFVNGLEGTKFGAELKKCNGDIDFSKINDGINQEVTEDKTVTELWVSQFGHEITELSVYTKTNDADALNTILQPTFGGNVTVEVPEGATSLRSVLGEIRETITEYYSGMYSPETLPQGTSIHSTTLQHQSAT